MNKILYRVVGFFLMIQDLIRIIFVISVFFTLMNFPSFLKIIIFFVIIIFFFMTSTVFEELRIFILQDVPQFELT